MQLSLQRAKVKIKLVYAMISEPRGCAVSWRERQSERQISHLVDLLSNFNYI